LAGVLRQNAPLSLVFTPTTFRTEINYSFSSQLLVLSPTAFRLVPDKLHAWRLVYDNTNNGRRRLLWSHVWGCCFYKQGAPMEHLLALTLSKFPVSSPFFAVVGVVTNNL
jgi:hypothetical protein